MILGELYSMNSFLLGNFERSRWTKQARIFLQPHSIMGRRTKKPSRLHHPPIFIMHRGKFSSSEAPEQMLGLDNAMETWNGIEHVSNREVRGRATWDFQSHQSSAMNIDNRQCMLYKPSGFRLVLYIQSSLQTNNDA